MVSVASAPAGLQISSRIEERLRRGELTAAQVGDFRDFLAEVDRDLMHHRIILDNPYCRWFRQGKATDQELRHFIRQFSVFSNQFLFAALARVINVPACNRPGPARRFCSTSWASSTASRGRPRMRETVRAIPTRTAKAIQNW